MCCHFEHDFLLEHMIIKYKHIFKCSTWIYCLENMSKKETSWKIPFFQTWMGFFPPQKMFGPFHNEINQILTISSQTKCIKITLWKKTLGKMADLQTSINLITILLRFFLYGWVCRCECFWLKMMLFSFLWIDLLWWLLT